ncbi:hypothetical protein LZ023_39900 (plasmid) [Pseudomonas silvicola]|nr:hypothetical protein LZ023_39900 [Pseudomonas silvicola]
MSHGESIIEYADNIGNLTAALFWSVFTGRLCGKSHRRSLSRAYCRNGFVATSLREDPPEQRELLDKASQTALMGDFNGFSQAVLKPSLHSSRQNDAQLIDKIRVMGKHLVQMFFEHKPCLIAVVSRSNRFVAQYWSLHLKEMACAVLKSPERLSLYWGRYGNYR